MIQDKQIYNTLLTKAGISNTLPQIVSYTPIITEQDYQNGNIYRYFIYDAVENKWTEINKTSYIRVKNIDRSIFTNRYVTVELLWRITGPLTTQLNNGVIDIGVLKTNELQVLQIDAVHPGFRNKFLSYDQYHEFSSSNNS